MFPNAIKSLWFGETPSGQVTTQLCINKKNKKKKSKTLHIEVKNTAH